MNDDHALPASAPARRLTEEELCLMQARQITRDLGVRLLAHPVDPETYQALRDYLDQHADQALAAFRSLMDQGPEQLQVRVIELLRARPGALLPDPAGDTAEGQQ